MDQSFSRATRDLLLHTQRPAEPAPCPGSDADNLYPPEDVTARDASGKATYALSRCPACRREFVVRIVRSRKGTPLLYGGVAPVPRHRAAQEG